MQNFTKNRQFIHIYIFKNIAFQFITKSIRLKSFYILYMKIIK